MFLLSLPLQLQEAGMIYRLTHKSYMVNMNGASYGMNETKEWLKKEDQKEKEI